jgi:hypothetical protein
MVGARAKGPVDGFMQGHGGHCELRLVRLEPLHEACVRRRPDRFGSYDKLQGKSEGVWAVRIAMCAVWRQSGYERATWERS